MGGSSSGDSDFELTPRLGGISKVSLSPNSSQASYSSTSIDLTAAHKPSQAERADSAPLNLSGSDDAYDSDQFENIAAHADDDVNLSGSDGLPSPLTTTKTGVVANHFFYSEDDFSVAAPEERSAPPEVAQSTGTSARPQSTAASARESTSPMDTARSLDSQDLVSQRNSKSHPPPPVIPAATGRHPTPRRRRAHAHTYAARARANPRPPARFDTADSTPCHDGRT
jgi:hypothetical protein